MDGGVAIASGVTALVTILVQISKLSYSFAVDVRSASQVQKTYFQEVRALKDVLERLDRALQSAVDGGIIPERPASISDEVVEDCRTQLESQQSKLDKGIKKLVWPFQEREIRKKIDSLSRFRSIFADCITALVSYVEANPWTGLV